MDGVLIVLFLAFRVAIKHRLPARDPVEPAQQLHVHVKSAHVRAGLVLEWPGPGGRGSLAGRPRSPQPREKVRHHWQLHRHRVRLRHVRRDSDSLRVLLARHALRPGALAGVHNEVAPPEHFHNLATVDGAHRLALHAALGRAPLDAKRYPHALLELRLALPCPLVPLRNLPLSDRRAQPLVRCHLLLIHARRGVAS